MTIIEWIYFVIILTINLATSLDNKMGLYTGDVVSIEVMKECSSENIQVTARVQKYNKTAEYIRGKVKIQQEIGPLRFDIEIEKFGQGGYKKFMLDQQISEAYTCEEENFSVFIKYFFSDLNFEENCILEPVETELIPRNFNQLLHNHTDLMVYGTFRATLTISDDSVRLSCIRLVFKINKAHHKHGIKTLPFPPGKDDDDDSSSSSEESKNRRPGKVLMDRVLKS